ncbi:MAG: methyltransferase domain-containing protein [Alphaproteobacteria bacterium]|nr:methyltransferase domain-containing protein [Alphaproteobacteria bacterium]
MVWDPQQYLAFAAPRLQPAIDLLARVPIDAPGTVVDLGCGPGNVTPLLRQRWPSARMVGLDNSDEMLARARDSLPDVTFEKTDIANWQPDTVYDIIYSNAALQWIVGHDDLFANIAARVAPGGVLAVQMPRNFEAPSHSLMLDVVREGPWREILEPVWVNVPTQAPSYYYNLLDPLVRDLHIWETEYLQVLEGDNPVAEYTKGTWLTRFLNPLDEPWCSEFEAIYRDRIVAAYPPESNGKTLFPFRRLFIVASF